MFASLFVIVVVGVTAASLPSWNATYPIDANAIVSEPTSGGSVLQDLGPCTCDMTFSLCDAGCGCDPDCSDEERALFSATLPASPTNVNVKRCVDAASVDVNPRSQLIYSLADNLLCVQEMNNPFDGVYYSPPPDAISASMFSAYRSMKPFSFEAASSLGAEVPATINYQTGSPIVAAASSTTSGALMPFQFGFLPLPKPDWTNNCNDHSFALFQQPGATSCKRVFSDLASACTVDLNAAAYTSNLRIGKSSTATPIANSSYVLITISSVTYQNRSTGLRAALGSISAPTYDSATCTCRNALKEVSYTLQYDKNGWIVSAAADVVLSEAVPFVGCSQSPSGSLEQSYSVKFVRAWDQADVSRGKSGNPGYVSGYPILTGQLVTLSGKQAIQQYINGMTVFGPSSTCSNLDRVSAGFNESMQSSCLVSLSASELQTVCQSGRLFDVLRIDNPLYVGQWGSSSYTDPSMWIQIDQEVPSTTFTWSTATRSCADIVSSINFEFVTAALGSINNPQSKILAARVRYGTSTWRMTTLSDSKKQPFELKATVTFITIPDGGSTIVIPPAPSIFPKLPADVLYPLVS